ncbi:hypothetical protein L2E82_22583 [Cichorium intybus]|uniref:Uncharacterized protein n=1 Tax=Cichorium intybus TaxID=13427 RepID=A0ACB9DYL6_CICIN|nr:hypothetical protein L2E82_22583 [Cichorium intybus]
MLGGLVCFPFSLVSLLFDCHGIAVDDVFHGDLASTHFKREIKRFSFTMIGIMNSVKTPINEVDKCLDSQLWHACAGGMVQLPPLNSKVFYFPQGHAEHAASGNVNFGDFHRIPPYILCQVSTIKFMADPDTDEVYAQIGLHPVRNHTDFDSDSDGILGFDQKNQNQEDPTSFAKTLTQSDANNGGGFSVPRYCAETIFPKLDYAADPPVQTILAKDVHGKIWNFRHIYRGTPRRHLLTTGWSNFVNHKKLIAGDSIVFLRADNGDLCVGIRRAKRGINENNDKFLKNPIEKFNGESMIEAVKLAANGQPFEVFYYPRATTPEFFVKASTVMAAMRVQWCPGIRFKMAFETEDSSRISWFMGTVSSIHVNDQTGWPNSPWRLLQVTWDEPDLLQNVKRVNPCFKKKDDDDEKDKRKRKKPSFVLFGQPILTEQQLADDVAPNVSDGSVVLQNGPVETSSDEAGPWSKQKKSSR